MKRVFVVGALLIVLTACGQNKEPAETGEATSAEPVVETVDAAPSSQDPNCDPKTNPGVDCACFDNLLENNWSDDLDSDVSTILANSTEDLPQESIDALIDVALQADDKCAARQ